MTQFTAKLGLTDDDGTKTTGTPFDEAWGTTMATELDTHLHSATNTTIKATDIIDEVVTARGSKSTLTGRLDVSMNADGTLKSPAGLITTANLQETVGLRNLVPDSRLQIWAAGDSVAPTGWTLSGTGAAAARTGAGLGDTTNPSGNGGFAAKLTYGSAAAKLTRVVISVGDFPPGTAGEGFQGKFVTFGCFARASAVNQASIILDTGIGTTRGGESGNGTFVETPNASKWIYGTRKIGDGVDATKLDIILECAVSGSAYFSAIVVAFGDIELTGWISERWEYIEKVIRQSGNLAVDTKVNNEGIAIPTPALFLGTHIIADTAPTSSAAIWDVNKGGSSAYSTLPQLDDGQSDNGGYDAPDGTYANRCFAAFDIATLDCDQKGSGTAGADAVIVLRFYAPVPETDYLGSG